VNMPDFTRYSRSSVKWQIIYPIMLPLFFVFICFIGVACTSAGALLYGQVLWDPNQLISQWGNRAARFFGGFSFALAALGVNISANSLSAANDLAALMPTYINIRRGQLLCAVIAWALVPWKILASAGSFLNFMSAYSIFLGAISAILCADFWIVKKRKYDVVALFHPYGPYSKYWYTWGINWRAWLAFLFGIGFNMPGFINSINPNIDVGVWVHPYEFGWLLSSFAAAFVYILTSILFPPRRSFSERAVYPDEIYSQYASTQVTEGIERRSEDELKMAPKWHQRFL